MLASMKAKAVYATQAAPLRAQLNGLLASAPADKPRGTVHAVIVPDSNLLEGGAVSARVFRMLEHQAYRNVIVISPSHSGGFRRINVCSLETYQTPLGAVPISSRLRDELCDEDDDIFVGDEGHFHPSGAYAQLPFLQTVLKSFDVVPVVMGEETPDMCRELGHAVGEIMYNQSTLVVACANIRAGAPENVEKLGQLLEYKDVSGLMRLMNSSDLDVEGKGAILVALLASMHRRAANLHVLDLSGPQDDTPGFIGAIISN